MEAKIIVSPTIIAFGFKKFEKYHAQFLKHDNLSAKERFLKSGGKLPTESKEK